MQLRNLNLGHNNLGDEMICELSTQGLVHNTTLRSLNLRRNGIGNVGAIALANAVEKHPLLNSIYLENNRIGDDGAVSLITKSRYFHYYYSDYNDTASAFDTRSGPVNQLRLQKCGGAHCCSTRSIYLQHNSVTSIGANRILNFVRNNHCNSRIIKFDLHMSRGGIQPDQYEQVRFYIKLNRLCRRVLMIGQSPRTTEHETPRPSIQKNCKVVTEEDDYIVAFHDDGGGGEHHGLFPLALWPNLLAKLVSINDVSSIHYLLCHKPELFQF